MIAFVRGQVASVTLSSAVLEVGGVGLELMCTPATLATLRSGQLVTLPTSMVVREEYEPWQWSRFTVPQGMTGWWQVHRRGFEHQHLCTADDLYYIQNYSLMLDIRILMRTVAVVLSGEGAY